MFEQPQFGRFVESLEYLGKGMLGIMIVMGVIILTTVLLNKLSAKKKKED